MLKFDILGTTFYKVNYKNFRVQTYLQSHSKRFEIIQAVRKLTGAEAIFFGKKKKKILNNSYLA